MLIAFIVAYYIEQAERCKTLYCHEAVRGSTGVTKNPLSLLSAKLAHQALLWLICQEEASVPAGIAHDMLRDIFWKFLTWPRYWQILRL